MDEVSTSSSSIFLVEQFTNLKFIDQQNIREQLAVLSFY